MYTRIPKLSNVPFITYPGAIHSLRNLSKLKCNSDIGSEFFFQLSQICHHIQTLDITVKDLASNGLSDLLSVQRNLKSLRLFSLSDCKNFRELFTFSLRKFSNTLIKLTINLIPVPLSSFNFTILQELVLSFNNDAETFKNIQYITFPRLEIFKSTGNCPNHEHLTKFLENNGKNIKEIVLANSDDLSNLAISTFCTNLKSLYTIFKSYEVGTIKKILKNFQQLESLETWCDDDHYFINESRLLELVVRGSQKNFLELKIHYADYKELFSEELWSVFKSLENHKPRKSLSLVIFNESFPIIDLKFKKDSMRAVDRLKNLGVVSKFRLVSEY